MVAVDYFIISFILLKKTLVWQRQWGGRWNSMLNTPKILNSDITEASGCEVAPQPPRPPMYIVKHTHPPKKKGWRSTSKLHTCFFKENIISLWTGSLPRSWTWEVPAYTASIFYLMALSSSLLCQDTNLEYIWSYLIHMRERLMTLCNSKPSITTPNSFIYSRC